MNEYEQTFNFFKNKSVSNKEVFSWKECQAYFQASSTKDWIYLIKFTDEIYSWGTASNKGDRLRKTGVFPDKLVGKYDRKVDYLMLKIIFGNPTVHLFEFINTAREIEQERRVQFYGRTSKGACLRGLKATQRDEIANQIYELFKLTNHYLSLDSNEKALFTEFVSIIWLGKLKHPSNPTRTFYYGDCLEPNFISRTLGRSDLIPVIEKALKVKF